MVDQKGEDDVIIAEWERGLIDMGANDTNNEVQLKRERFFLPTSVTSWLGPNSHKICEQPNSLAFSLGKMPEVSRRRVKVSCC